MTERKVSEKEDRRAYLYALLSGRPYTAHEVEERLLKKGAGRVEALELVEEFAELGLIDDGLYARLFAEGHENWGNERIRYELRRRGLDEGDIHRALEDGDEGERARPVAEAWTNQGLAWGKIEARLKRRGFSNRTISSLRPNRSDSDW